jgi:hypothetical protein
MALDMALLAGLRRVKWRRLHHAYGDASDVPELLEDLASRDAERRQDALLALFGNIHHQSTVYEATPHAVPFLVELAEAREVVVRVDVLNLIACIADGSGKWAAASRRAVAELLPRIARLLHEPAHDVVFGAALVMSRFHERGPELAPALQAAVLRVPPGKWQACMVTLVGKLGHVSSYGFLETQARSTDATVRFGAHLALVLALGPKAPPAAVAAAREIVENEELLEERLGGLPWDLGAKLNPDDFYERLR